MSRTTTSLPVGPEPEQSASDIALSKAYTGVIRQVAGRSDISVRVARRTRATAGIERRNGQPVFAPGAYWRDQLLVELDGSLVGPDAPADLDPRNVRHIAAIAELHGVACHEAAHAAHTELNLDDAARGQRRAALLLEEVRVERAHLDRRPPDARWLRAASRILLRYELVSESSLLWDAAKVALLTCGRVAAGSLTPADVTPARDAAIAVLGMDRFAELEKLWRTAVTVDDGDADAMLRLAAAWCAVVDVPVDVDPEAGSGDTAHSACSPDTEPGRDPGAPAADPASSSGASASDGTGDGPVSPGSSADQRSEGTDDAGDEQSSAPTEQELRDALRDALVDVGTATTAGAAQEIVEEAEVVDTAHRAEQELHDRRKEIARRKADEAAERARDAKNADEVFPPSHGRGDAGHTPAVRQWRPPTAAERTAAATLARALERDLWRPPDSFELRSPVPPGRLHARGAVAQAAQIAVGRPVTATPWKRTLRTPEPPLKLVVGLAVDRSGSMSSLMGPAASAAWVVANAVKRISGRFAAVTFGERTEPLARPGTVPDRVPVLSANAGWESIGSALAVLDGALRLQDPAQIRVLCVVSDGHWVNDDERRAAERRLAKLARSGCGLLLVNAGPLNTAVAHMRHLELSDAASMGTALAREIRTALALA